MADENVVRRNPKNNRRKNTDGYRTDSGCFEDVDFQTASRHSPLSASSEPVVVHREKDVSSELSDLTDTPPIPSSLSDDCAEDKDFHAILKRLSDITTDPADLYRLCFSSRLSFCGHMSGNGENEKLFRYHKDVNQNDTTLVEQTNNCTDNELPDEPMKKSSHGRQCADLLTMLSSFIVKAREDPNMLNHSSFGPSIVTQLSSLLSTLDEAKANIGQSNVDQSVTTCQGVPPDSFKPTHVAVSECNALSELDVTEGETSFYAQNSNKLAADVEDMTLKKYDAVSSTSSEVNATANKNPLDTSNKPPSALKKHETPLANLNPATSFTNHATSENSFVNEEKQIPFSNQEENVASNNRHSFSSTDLKTNNTNSGDPKLHFPSNTKKPSISSGREELQTDQTPPTVHLEGSYVCSTQETFVDYDDATSLGQTIIQGQQPLNVASECSKTIPTIRNVVGRSSTSSITNADDVVPVLSPADIQDKHPQWIASKDNKTISELHRVDGRSSTRSITDADDVVSSGRRAVKPYSWDYGDIWEKEIELHSRKNAPVDMMPSFEEIRDELFQNAGFFKTQNSKRRSRSADARSSLRDDREMWPEQNVESDMHSPFIRTIFQNENRPSTGLRRSWSSHHLDSVKVNVDWTHGRQTRVISGYTGQGFDNVQAQIIRDAVVQTSTFRGPKPWSVLKRKPSGLRRRSAKRDSQPSNKSDKFSSKLDRDSESSDSPYVSTTSSDCLTTATDDNSSITSSLYYGKSSLPSSPSVSNRNSACFSDTSTSDASDIRRIVQQSPSSEFLHGEMYARSYNIPSSHRVTLDQRFGFIERNCVSPNEGVQNVLTMGLKSSPIKNEFRDESSKNILSQTPNLHRSWQRDDNLVSPLHVRSDSDLNRLTKVQFVGDSYSRSRISKNVRYTRNRSQGPSPVVPSSAHTRVVSCEIVPSDERKQDVYTKVKIAEPRDDEESRLIGDGRKTKFGYPSTRRSWHGQSPTRFSSHYNERIKSINATNASSRYSQPLRSKQPIQFQKEGQVHAKLVDVKNQRRLNSHWSTSKLRPSSESLRLLSSNPQVNRPCEYPSGNFTSNADMNRNYGQKWRNIERTQTSAVGISQKCRQPPPDYFTAVKRSQGLQRRAYFAEAEKQEKNKCSVKLKDHMAVEDPSFVGSSSFATKKLPSNPLFPRPRRSRSFNENETVTVRRLNDSDFYRKRAMEISQKRNNEWNRLNETSRNDSAAATSVHHSDRSKLYNEDLSGCPNKNDVTSPQGIINVSYCDPNQGFIPEGSFSVENVETACGGEKSEDSRTGSHKLSNDHALVTNHFTKEKKALKNEHRMADSAFLNDFEEKKIAQNSYNSVQVNTSKEANLVSVSCSEVSKDPAGLSLCVESRKTVTSTNSSSCKKSDTVSSLVSSASNGVCEVILAQQLPFKKVDDDSDRANVSTSPYDDSTTVTTVVPSLTVFPQKLQDETSEFVLAPQLHNKTNEELPHADELKTNIDVDVKQKMQCGNVDGTNSITSSNAMVPSVTIDTLSSGKSVSKQEKKEEIIRSPILLNRKTHGNPSEINVFIDYRNKRPVSIEYTDDDVSFLTTLGSSAKTTRKNKQGGGVGCRGSTKRNITSYRGLKSDVYDKTTINCEEVNNSQINRKDIHEKDATTNHQIMPAFSSHPFPEPYRHDSTIIYTDARTSFGSDTDSISRDSTISSSGSDMTVILHEDMDISVEDLKQLTETSSKIGIAISPVVVETNEDYSNELDNELGELPPAMELSNSFRKYEKCLSDHSNINANRELAVTKVRSSLRERTSSPVAVSQSNMLKRFIDEKNNECLSNDSLVPSSIQASCSSIASSRESGKSAGTESGKGRDLSKNSKKGLLSKFKRFRNSFRGKKSDSISCDKKGLTISTDGNANVLSKPYKRTKSESVMSRRSYDAFRHPNTSLRDVVGLKSVSSDHLNTYRINNKSHMDEINAKSLEMLVETCI